MIVNEFKLDLKYLWNSLVNSKKLEEKEIELSQIMASHQLLLKEKERLDNELTG